MGVPEVLNGLMFLFLLLGLFAGDMTGKWRWLLGPWLIVVLLAGVIWYEYPGYWPEVLHRSDTVSAH